jgi:dUTP pyrophosphatase
MKVRIKRFNKDLPLPRYKTSGAAGFDMYAREDIAIPPKGIGYIHLNVAMEIPAGYFSLLVARSSTHKMGLMLANGAGILDSDYRGDNDEYIAAVFNFTDIEVLVEKGTRVAQVLLMKHELADFEEVDQLSNDDRSGFGSTGIY